MFLKQTYFILVKCYAFTFVLLIPFFLAAQSHSATISHFITDNGLPQNSVKDIEIDNNGYYWLATELGLCRFDGVNFKLFNPTVNYTVRASFLSTDINNNIYVYYDYQDKYSFNIDSNNNAAFSNCFATADFEKEGYIFDKQWMNNLFKQKNVPLAGLPDNQIRIGLKSNECYILSKHPQLGNQIFYCNKNEIKYIPIQQNLTNYTILDGCLMIWDENKNTYTLLKDGNIISTTISLKGSLGNEPIVKNNPRVFSWCKNGSFVYCNNKIYKLSLKEYKLSAELIFDNLQFIDVLCINYNPLNDKYFVGTATEGLYILSKPTLNVLKIPSKEKGINIFYAQQLVNEKLFANGYLFSNDAKIEKIITDAANFNLSTDKKNRLLYTKNTNSFSLNFYDYNKKSAKSISSSPPNGLSIIMYNEFDSCNYVGNLSRIGKVINDSISWLSLDPAITFINTILFYNKDSLLIGTKHGLFSFNLTTKLSRKLIPEGDFRTIYRDKYNNYWCGTYANGFYVIKKTGIVKLPADYSNRLQGVHSFYQDKKNRLWMTTNNGLLVAKISDLLAYNPINNNGIFYHLFDKSDGLITNEFNGGCSPSALVLPNGILSLPSMNGIVQFNPDELHLSSAPKKLYIDKITYNNLPFKYDNKFLFPKESKQISFAISYPYYGKRDEIILQYQLANHGDKWFEANNNIITFSELPHGNFTLLLKIRGSDLVLKKINFSIDSYFYQTWWFAIISALLLSFLVYLFYKYRLRKIQNQNRTLVVTVAEKTKELNKIISNLDENVVKLEKSESELNSLVVIQNKILNLVLHDLKSPLKFLKTISTNLSNFYKEKNVAETEHAITALTNGIDEVHNFTSTFFEWIYYQRRGIKPLFEKHNLSDIFNELSDLFKSISSNNIIQFQPNNISLSTDKNILIIILRNIIDNANKNTANGKIAISALKNEDNVIISISDTGSGFPQNKLELINNIIKKNDSPEKLSSFGYKIIVELSQLIQANLEIINLENGARVELTIYN